MMGKQSKTIRNKRKIKVDNYENHYIDENIEVKHQVSKAVTREVKFTIVSIFIVTIVMISSAYAIFSTVQKQESYNTLTVGTLKIDFDSSSTDMGNIINLNGAYPTSDEEGQKTNPYSFRITNSGTLAAAYKVKIIDDQDMINEDKCQDNLLPKANIKVSINGGTPFLLNSVESNEYVINSDTLNPSGNKNFAIRIWIDEKSGNEVLGKHYHGKIVVESANTKEKEPEKLCKRATTLHTETCTNEETTFFCQADGYALNDTITYGNLGTKEVLTSGDAFDCDVNGDGVYDSTTERFYYVSDMTNGITTDANTAVLIYYNNVSGGVASNSTAYAYDSSGSNDNGPITAIKQLPTTSQWKNVSLKSAIRDITDEQGVVKRSSFSYDGYAARLLTTQEVETACNVNVGSNIQGELKQLSNCKFLMENTKYSSSSDKIYAHWLETPSSISIGSWHINGDGINISSNNETSNYELQAVRPAIEVAKSRIDF
ncbi:MAG: hypothetical protein Q4E39_03045 [bacterium]|nr:hypothetical protein [bacterium]